MPRTVNGTGHGPRRRFAHRHLTALELDSIMLAARFVTALGFVAFQSVQNVAFKSGTAWLDPAESPEPVKEALPADPQASFS